MYTTDEAKEPVGTQWCAAEGTSVPPASRPRSTPCTAAPVSRRMPPVPTSRRSGSPPLPLSSGQLAAVRRFAPTAPTVISGAPGRARATRWWRSCATRLAAGRSVLVAAKDDAAVDALTALLGRQPGLMPVVFGSSEQRERLAQRLSNGELVRADHRTLQAARAALDHAVDARDAARSREADVAPRMAAY
ncbi:MAG: hypothetical protein R2713_00250 [Ilumatobacteraceae bacterium]